MPKYAGSCHCGGVRFALDADISELTTCDCSLCARKNALMAKVHESAFQLQSAWDTVSLYQWNTGVAKHYFCKTCGIYTFHRKRALPDHFGINVFCIEGFDPNSVATRATEGASMSLENNFPGSVWLDPEKDS